MSKDTKSDNTCLTSDTENFSSSLFNLSSVCKKPIELGFTAEKISSDGGLLLLREVETQSGILKAITHVLLHTLRTKTLRATAYATATMKTIRLRLIKIAA